MTKPIVAIGIEMSDALRAAYRDALTADAEIMFLADLDDAEKLDALDRARYLITHGVSKTIGPDAPAHVGHLDLIQFVTAGVDHISFSELPADVPCAANGGGYAQAMAEHVVALAFALGKRLRPHHAALAGGEFNQFGPPNKQIKDGVCAILGFGGIGRESARRLSCLGMKIHALNRSGKTDEPVDFIGTMADLETVLGVADMVVISLPLTKATDGLIGARELGWMKPDASLINVARGEIVDETALYEHLVAHPDFHAGIESWWVEPARHGEFRVKHPFLDLPNVIACPHNSARVPATAVRAARNAAENVLRAIRGEVPRYLAGPDERLR